ncbi:MAG: type III polyketide synthase [Sphingomonas fennica]
MTEARIAGIGVAVPRHDIHAAFIDWAGQRLPPRDAALFRRMADRAGIGQRFSVLADPVGPGGFYADAALPTTAPRMAAYAAHAPDLALAAIDALVADIGPLGAVSHLIVASCTGFTAPGLDQIVARRAGLGAGVERTLVGFMGCYAAVAALRLARHIVRSEPQARVLVLTVELSTLHLQPTAEVGELLAMLQFGDGAAAALVTGGAGRLTLGEPFSATLEDSDDLIRWTIGDQGFAMHLSGEVPGRIAAALAAGPLAERLAGGPPIDGWAVHAGGRSILDAVARALHLPEQALAPSRAVLAGMGNMSSTTLMAVLARTIGGPRIDNGVALAFGPGLAAEGMRFAVAP